MRPTNTRYDTYPVIWHAAGAFSKSDMWRDFRNQWQQTFIPSWEPLRDVEVITWDTKQRKSLLMNSLAEFHVSPINLAHGITDWRNIDKARLTADYLEYSESKYVIGLDSWDVLCAEHPMTALRRFREMFNCRMLFNAATIAYPRPFTEIALASVDKFESEIDAPYRHLNAGAWIAEREFAVDFFREVYRLGVSGIFDKRLTGREQPAVKLAAFVSTDDIEIDSKCVIFQHASGWEDVSWT